MRYTIIIYFGFLKGVDYNNKKWQYSFWYQWTKSSTLASFLLSLHYSIYGNNMYFDSRYAFGVFFFIIVCLPALCSLAHPQQPHVNVDLCSILLQLYPILLISLRHFFCISVVSRTNLSCFIVNNFQSNLNPKDFFFSRRLSCFCFTLTENMSVLRCLWFQFIAGIFVYFFQRDTCRRRLARSLWKPHKPEWQW